MISTCARYLRTVRAFVRMGIQATLSYPMSFLLSQFGIVLTVITVFFLSRIVRNGPIVADHYVAYVVVGLFGQTLVAGALRGVGLEIDAAIQQGRLEMLLIEPVPWAIVPVGLALWPILLSLTEVVVLLAIGLAFGVRMSAAGLALALPLIVLSVLSGLAIGILAASVRILAKRSDPLWVVYNILSGLVGGTSLPINVLPGPLRAVSWLLPTMYADSGLRKLILPHAAHVYGPTGLWATVSLSLAIVPLFVVAVVVFNRSVNTGRRLGVLAGY